MVTGRDHGKVFEREHAFNYYLLPKTHPIASQPIFVGDEEMVELPLVVTGGIATDLEAWATKEGLTTGQLMRRIIRSFLIERLP